MNITKEDLREVILPQKSHECLVNLKNTELYQKYTARINNGEPEALDDLVDYIGEMMYRYGMQESFALAAMVNKLTEDGIIAAKYIYEDILKHANLHKSQGL